LTLWAVAAAAVLLLSALLLVPRRALTRSQDRLAQSRLEAGGPEWKLLTRADLVVSRYRRLPGILGLTEDALVFEGIFGEREVVATSRIQKIATGRRMASGRKLVRLEVLRVTRSAGDELEFVLSRASVSAWRSHLGLWAARERQADADRISPGRG
jgi:hypothetical protein